MGSQAASRPRSHAHASLRYPACARVLKDIHEACTSALPSLLYFGSSLGLLLKVACKSPPHFICTGRTFADIVVRATRRRAPSERQARLDTSLRVPPTYCSSVSLY